MIRGLDKNMVIEGLEYASYLINKICGGLVSKNIEAGKLDSAIYVFNFSFAFIFRFKIFIQIPLPLENKLK